MLINNMFDFNVQECGVDEAGLIKNDDKAMD